MKKEVTLNARLSGQVSHFIVRTVTYFSRPPQKVLVRIGGGWKSMRQFMRHNYKGILLPQGEDDAASTTAGSVVADD